MYQDLYDRAKKIIKNDSYVKFHNASRSLYLETDASGTCLGTRLLQVWDGMNYGHDEVLHNATLHSIAFISKRLLSTE